MSRGSLTARGRARIALLLGAVALTPGGGNPGSAAQPPSFTLPSTFLATSTPVDAPLTGEWLDDDVRLVVAPRTARGLTGVIPRGRFEGVLHLPEVHQSGSSTVAAGTWIVAARSLGREPAQLTVQRDTLALRIGNRPVRHLRRGRAANLRRLAGVTIIAHRGLSLDDAALMNADVPTRHAWFFGASGVELDVTVPHDDARAPLVRDIRVHHPAVVRSELTGFDSTHVAKLTNAPTPTGGIDAAAATGIRLVYLDAKLRWLRRQPATLQQAIEELVRVARNGLNRHPELQILIGAETAETAASLAGTGVATRHPRLGWAHELTRGTAPGDLVTRASQHDAARPAVLSLSLLRLRGAGGGPLGWLLGDIDRTIEHRLTGASQPLIFWTASDDTQFAGVLDALQRMTPAGRTRSSGIITPFPHRLAYFLATADEREPSSRAHQ